MARISDRFTEDVLVIAAAASTIKERLSGGLLLPDDTAANREAVQARLVAWCQNSAEGNWEQFRARLARDHSDLDTVQQVLGPMRVDLNYTLPAWAKLLREVLLFTDKAPGDEATYSLKITQFVQSLETKRQVPFGEILAPFVVIAHQKLTSQVGRAFHLLSEQAHATLQGKLLCELVSCAVDALHLEFSEECTRTQEDESTYYRQFVEQMRSARLAAFFRKYSALARLLATLSEQWIAATAAFLQHLAADWSDIQNMLGTINQADRVEAIQPALSKTYHGGRRVMALTFALGGKVVYKPRDIGLEEAYHQLLAWCNQQNIAPQFKVLACLNRADHGWVEYVEHQSCQNQQEIHNYCQRAGMLLCLISILGGRNCLAHHIIACGEHPVLIDPSILMQPYLSPRDLNSGLYMPPEQSDEHLISTVLHTGLLATWQLSRDKQRVCEISGLGAPGMTSLAQQEPVRANGAPNEVAGGANIPLLNGCPQRLEDYVKDVIAGFQILYYSLLNHREDLLAADSPLYRFERQPIRFLLRPDWMYPAMRAKLLTPASLRDGVAHSISMELLGLAINQRENEAEKRHWWPLFKAEQQAMLRQDTPLFTMRANSIDLLLETDERIERAFQKPGFSLVIDRLRRLSNEQLTQQINLLRAALCVPATGGRTSLLAEDDTRMRTSAHSPTNEELIAQALAIAEQIGTRTVPLADESITWLAPWYLSPNEQYQLQPMEYSLYAGTCGVALFLAALENVARGAGYRQVILRAMRPVIAELQKAPAHIVGAIGIGGVTGLGSIVYALTRMSQFLDEPVLLDSARQAARAITTEDIESDNALDILAGAAGAILGLLVLYDAFPEQSILDRAILCGQHLLRTRTVNKGEYRVWPTLQDKCLTGFSHGAAGIAYALLRLYAITQDASLLQAAKEGIAYEDSLFSTKAGNWPDLRFEPPSFACAWCHGAPGIGLARAGGLSILDTPQIRQDVDHALQTTQQCNLLDQDHLCCGNMGRVDILLTASTLLSRPDLAKTARGTAGQILRRARERGAFSFHFQFPPQVYNAELFQGTSGIGYELLRIAYPDRVPSLLLLQ